jgi:uncharacterized protein YdeI (YjbR/CyaY-like superfamily)
MKAGARSREVRFFPDAARFRGWLVREHRRSRGVWIKFHRVDSGLPSPRFFDVLAEALCFGWVDGLRKRAGTTSYLVHFAPRQSGSHWSRPNIARAKALIASGRMTAAGRKVFSLRDETKTRVFATEVRRFKLSRAAAAAIRANAQAWEFYRNQPPFYQRATTMWVMSAVKPETHARRLAKLVDLCARGRRVKPFDTPARPATA